MGGLNRAHVRAALLRVAPTRRYRHGQGTVANRSAGSPRRQRHARFTSVIRQRPVAVLSKAISHLSLLTESSRSPSLSTVIRDTEGASLISFTWTMRCVDPSNSPAISSAISSGAPPRSATCEAFAYSAGATSFIPATGNPSRDRRGSAAPAAGARSAAATIIHLLWSATIIEQ